MGGNCLNLYQQGWERWRFIQKEDGRREGEGDGEKEERKRRVGRSREWIESEKEGRQREKRLKIAITAKEGGACQLPGWFNYEHHFWRNYYYYIYIQFTANNFDNYQPHIAKKVFFEIDVSFRRWGWTKGWDPRKGLFSNLGLIVNKVVDCTQHLLYV